MTYLKKNSPSLLCFVATLILLLTHSIAFGIEDDHKSAVLDPALGYSKTGMRAFQQHYTNFVLYTQNLFVPGNVEIGVYNEHIDDKIRTVPFYRWRAGPVEDTGDPFNFFIESQQKGFFVVRLPFGLGYTRDGRLMRHPNGRLVMLAGEIPVQGQSGDIYIPEGDLDVTTSGAIFIDGDQIDKFKVAVFRDRERLVTLNGSVFYMDGEPDLLVGEEHYRVRQGYIEASNVLKALTGDISIASKSYEGSARAAKVVTKLMNSAVQMGNPN